MATMNIRSDVKDSFYRYKMPRLVAKVEGKGNGIKTVIPNMAAIGKSLSRPPMYPCKYFGCELGAQTKYDNKNERYIVNGAHEAGKLQSLLDGFISRFVLCGACKNPETDLIFNKDGSICRDCKACGQRTDIDMRHRLVPFILKNPPPTASSGSKKRKGKKGGSADDAANGASPDEGDGSDDELTRRIREEAAALPAAPTTVNDDDDWAVDVSAEAQAQRMRELESSISTALVLGEDDDDDDDEDGGSSGPTAYDRFGEEVEKNPEWDDNTIVEKAKECGVFNKHRVVVVLVQVLFNEKLVQQVRKRAPLLRRFVTNEKAQKSLLGGIERVVGVKHPELIPKIPAVLKVLYDEDLLDEAVVLRWGAKSSRRYVDRSVSKKVRAAAEPFLVWLKEAEEESDEESDEE
ncbi:eukaryotic translation initiation factor 5 [Syncephalis pseudoplumigaleata]|uniref:Eukaryotic translation initiation factor 5 n=1 Tax=Syncephalis pseudoplumigaleata TaxID=1712513 RepID=A0A4P9Z2K8_9FUNG|nr:eukaryotic translation initiation factor 5 [Syncephalis pseudoplumigaleata]|eukprot:RKP26605.1 eukaryotic translation initiation factor 5 [Syncephalis pseudoplumigaleata]